MRRTHLERAFSNLDDKKIRIEAGLELIELHSASAQFDKALAVAAKLEELAPQNPQILFVTYQISRQMMDQSLLSMMMAAPDSAEMHMIMAGELGRQGDHANSIAQYREAIRLNPMLPGAHFRTRRATADLSGSRAERAGRRRIQSRHPGESIRCVVLAPARRNHDGEGRFQSRGGRLQKGSRPAAEGFGGKNRSGDRLISMNRTDEAISLLESAVKDDPTNIVAHYRLSGLYRRAGRTADAQRETDTFHHYQEVKDKLGKVFKQLAGQPARCEMQHPALRRLPHHPRASPCSDVCLQAQRRRAAPPARLPQLADITASTGIRFNHLASPDKKYIVESMSGGVALIDYDRDGWPDIYFTNAPDVDMQLAGKKARSALFHNNHDGTFTDVTDKAGVGYPCWANGAVVGDYNNDGWPDLLVTCFGGVVLYRNNGGATFTNVTREAGLAGDTMWAMGAAFGDYDGDGFQDLFVSHYAAYDLHDLPAFGSMVNCTYHTIKVQCGPAGLKGSPDNLYHNNGNGTFTDVSKQAGVDDPQNLLGLTAVWSDFDNDGKLELFVANDGAQNYLYKNDGKGHFTEVGFQAGVALDENGKALANMGVALGDYLHTGRPSIAITHFSEQYLEALPQRRQSELYRCLEHLAHRPRHHSRGGLGRRLLRYRQ